MTYWKGSEFLVELWNKRVSWVKTPIKRFIVSVLSIVFFVFASVWALDLFFDLLFSNKNLSQALQASDAPFWDVLLITMIINVFMHGRGFLIEWRQASIDIERLKTEQVFTQFQSLKNQVNPHFLFNSLNALSALVYEDQDKAVEFIRKLSRVYRYVLDKKEEEVVPIKDEVNFLKNFVFLQKIRFGDNLKFELSENMSKGSIPPLALQLLVENAIKHNVISDDHTLTIKVELQEEYCIITNNIKEKLTKDSTEIGLNNLKERYKYLSNKEVILFNDGKKFEVKIPILKFKNEIYNH
ncbi:MAG: histidine kinase [Bacteroidota bacterium]